MVGVACGDRMGCPKSTPCEHEGWVGVGEHNVDAAKINTKYLAQ
jgi:hypothetical protein